MTETVPLLDGTNVLLLTIINGDRFYGHKLVKAWQPLVNYKLVANTELLAMVGGQRLIEGPPSTEV